MVEAAPRFGFLLSLLLLLRLCHFCHFVCLFSEAHSKTSELYVCFVFVVLFEFPYLNADVFVVEGIN